MVLVCFSSLIRLSCAMRKSDSKTHRIRHVPTHKTHNHKTKKQTNHPKPDQTESTDQQTDNSKLKPNQTEDKQNKKQNTTKQSKPNKNQASSNVNISDAYLNMHKHHLTHYTDHHWSSLIITGHSYLCHTLETKAPQFGSAVLPWIVSASALGSNDPRTIRRMTP